MSRTTRRYKVAIIAGTSGADHLAYEVLECMATDYASRHAAIRGYQRACKRANDRRARLGYRRVGRPLVRPVVR